MKVFITGSTGLLGSTLLRSADKGITTAASFNINRLVPNLECKYYFMDITKKKLVNAVISDFKPDIVIHTAAIASPDYCDKHKSEATLVNIIGTKNIVEACEKNNSAIVFITTNGVYDGENPPYDENSRPNPIDHYGYTKYEGEKIVQSAGVPFIIIRLMTMYGWNNPNERQNPMTWLIEMVGKNKISVNVVSDMFNNFLSVKEAAKSIWRAIELKKYGESFNIAGKNCISRFEFSKQIAKVFNLDVKMIHPVNLSFFKNFVTRPKNTCFITKKMENVLGLKPLSTLSGLEYFKEHPITNNDWKKI